MRGRHSIFAVHYFFRCAPHVFSFSVSSATMSSKDVVARRRPLVQSIRQAGGRCNIRGMPDDAGRKRVESFVHRVLASAGPAKAKSLARASLTAYLATFQDSPAGTGSKKSKKSTARAIKGMISRAATEKTPCSGFSLTDTYSSKVCKYDVGSKRRVV